MSLDAITSLVRLDAALVERVRSGERLGELARAAALVIALGAGAYGAAFGLWRDPLQALFGALKLPCVLLGVAALTAASSAVLAPLLGARLRAGQSIVAVLASLAVTSALLGALAPVATLLVLVAVPPVAHDRVAVAQTLVLAHTLVIATAGTAGVLSLSALVRRLVPRKIVARRVVVAWMATQLLAGAQLSWLLRPFLGAPDRPVTLFSPAALEGGFFDEIWRLSCARFGDLAPFVLGALALALAAWIVVALTESRSVAVVVGASGLEVRGDDATYVVRWREVAEAAALGACVRILLARDETLAERVLEVPCATARSAEHLADEITRAMRADVGPYR